MYNSGEGEDRRKGEEEWAEKRGRECKTRCVNNDDLLMWLLLVTICMLALLEELMML